MSNRHSYEKDAIEQVCSYLRTTRGVEYRIAAEHVPVGNKNCDYLLALADGSATIAVEIVRLVDAPASVEQARWRSILWDALKIECSKRGISGYTVQTPWNLNTPPRDIRGKLAPKVADAVAEFLRSNPYAVDFNVDGFRFRRAPELEGIGAYASGGAHWIDMAGGAAGILEVLEDKDAQLALPATERILVAVPSGTELNANEIARELSLRKDLDRLHHADLVLNVPTGGEVSVVYARAVRDYFAGRTPFPSDHTALIDLWFRARLDDNREGTFELVRALRESKGSLGFLSVQAREALGHHGTNLIDQNRHDDAVWILHELYADPDPSAEKPIHENAITTVRGTAAFLLYRVVSAAPVEELAKFLEIARSLSADANLGVRRLAGHALMALMHWRDCHKNKQPLLKEELRLAIKRIWLDYIDSASANGLTDAARHTLDRVYDLTEVEVEHVIDALQYGRDWESDEVFARFIIYFAFLRSSDPGIALGFDDARLRERLKKLLSEEPEFCGQVAFGLRKSTQEHPEIRRTLEPLLVMLFDAARGERALKFTLDSAAFLARDGLLSSDTQAAILRAVGAAGPFKSHEAYFVAEGISELANALDANRSSLDSSSLFTAVRDPELQMAIAQRGDS
jgi:hypothetical protein